MNFYNEKSLTQISLCITLEREMEKKMVNINLSILIFCLTIYFRPLSRCRRNLKTLALTEAEKSVTENFIGEKENWTNKGNGKHQEADSLLHKVIPNICTKFQNPRCSCSWEIFDTNFPMYYIGVRDGKKEKEGKNKSQHLDFLSHNIPDHSQGVCKIWRLWLS